jgi:hypothetical protein
VAITSTGACGSLGDADFVAGGATGLLGPAGFAAGAVHATRLHATNTRICPTVNRYTARA